jgi:hypothetical protein
MTNPHEFQPKTLAQPNPDGVHCGGCRLQRDGGDWCHCYYQKLEGAGWRQTNDADDPQSRVWHEAERCDACLTDEKYAAYHQRVQEARRKLAEAASAWCEEDTDETRQGVRDAVDRIYRALSQPATDFLAGIDSKDLDPKYSKIVSEHFWDLA